MNEIENEIGIKFFELVYEDDEFCRELGKVVLAAGKLEAQLRIYLENKGVSIDQKKATLGNLIRVAKQKELLIKMVPALEMLKDQRNYLTHNMYSLFGGLIEQSILSKSYALDSDIYSLTEKAAQLKENLYGLAEIVANENFSK